MKRVSLALVGAILFALAARAQLSIECQGGVNLANLSNPGNLVAGAVWQTRIGFAAMASMNISLTDKMLISPGLRFVQKGTESKWWSNVTGSVQATVTNSYIEVPVYLKYELVDFGSKLFVLGGPAFAFLATSKTEGTVQFNGSNSLDTKEDYKSYDFSFDIGLAFQAPVSETLSIVATGAYSFGLVKIDQRGSDEQTRDVGVTLGALYRFK
jgi:hypothetical protein